MDSYSPSPNCHSAAVSANRPPQLFLFPLTEIYGYKVLTDRQRKFVEGVLSGLSDSEAARRAGYSAATARVRASQLRKNVSIQSVLNDAWVMSGNTPEAFIARIAERAQIAHEAMRRERPGSKEWRACQQAANQEDALLASIHGKLNLNVTHSGNVTLNYNEQVRVEILDAVSKCVEKRGGFYEQQD